MGYVRDGDMENEPVPNLFHKDSVIKILCKLPVDCHVPGSPEVESAFRRDPFSRLRLRIGLFLESSRQIMLVNNELRYGLYIIEAFEGLYYRALRVSPFLRKARYARCHQGSIFQLFILPITAYEEVG